MGQEIAETRFSPDDFARFGRRLVDETGRARQAFADGEFADDGRVAGFELEAWLIDRNFFPIGCNQAFLARLNDPLVVPELSRFNIELNGTPQALHGHAVSRLEDELTATWGRCQRTAHEEEATVIAIGTLPTLREADPTLVSMSPLKRYAALNRQVLEARGGRPLTLEIDGAERLRTSHQDVMLEVESLGNLLPNEIVNRPKMGFSFPWDEWLRTNLITYCESSLIALSKRELFKEGQILKLWEKFLKNDGSVNWSKIWLLVTLEQWMKNIKI